MTWAFHRQYYGGYDEMAEINGLVDEMGMDSEELAAWSPGQWTCMSMVSYLKLTSRNRPEMGRCESHLRIH